MLYVYFMRQHFSNWAFFNSRIQKVCANLKMCNFSIKKLFHGPAHIFCYILFIIYGLRVIIFMTSPLWMAVGFVVYIRRFIYKLFNVCPFDYTAVAGSGKVGLVNQVNHISWVAVVTPTDRPKSVRNCCVIDLFSGVLCVVTLPFWHFCWCRGFCHMTESDLFLFLFKGYVSMYATADAASCSTIAAFIPEESKLKTELIVDIFWESLLQNLWNNSARHEQFT